MSRKEELLVTLLLPQSLVKKIFTRQALSGAAASLEEISKDIDFSL